MALKSRLSSPRQKPAGFPNRAGVEFFPGGTPAMTFLADTLSSMTPHILTTDDSRALLQALPAAFYTTDANSLVTFYNEAAVHLWGGLPENGKDPFSGPSRLFWADGTRLPYASCPMVQALREKRPVRDTEIVAERGDGRRFHLLPFATPTFDEATGALTGATVLLVDLTERLRAEIPTQRLAAIVESSDDAIIAKDLDGIIMNWNAGAQRLFGYTAEEVVGQSVTILIPADRQDEEPIILGRIRRGERVEHYDTIRRRKDGSLIEISLTVSPIRNSTGEIVGASKIARDITERRRAEEQQKLLLREMDHRVKNLFALASSVVTLSARNTSKADELAAAVRARLSALARAHSLTLTNTSDASRSTEQPTQMHTLIRTILLPFDTGADGGPSQVEITGPDILVAGGSVTSLAMLLHEFAANAAKYGALSSAAGRLSIDCRDEGSQFVLVWSEDGGPAVSQTRAGGFGTLLGQVTVKSQLGGEITRFWMPQGLTIRLALAKDRLSA
jgi:PAS domain S-box-containing protein